MLLDIVLHDPSQLAIIASHTPPWVWVLLAGLLILGAGQLRPRRMSRTRAAVTPLVMASLSFLGMVSAFKASAQLGIAIGLWTATCAASMGLGLWLVRHVRSGSRYDATTRTHEVPGSMVPLVLIVGIFFTKYAAGIEMALQGQLIHDNHFIWSLACLYGLSSGTLLARGWRLWRMAPAPTANRHSSCSRLSSSLTGS